MTIMEFDKLCKKGKKRKSPERVVKTMCHCYNGTGWEVCDFWWYDKQKMSRCAMFGNAIKYGSEALKICDKIYSEHYDGHA